MNSGFGKQSPYSLMLSWRICFDEISLVLVHGDDADKSVT